MKAKTFEGNNIQEVLGQVKETLGDDAVILETKQLEDQRLFGLLRRTRVQVVAATGIQVASSKPAAPPPSFVAELDELRGEVREMSQVVKVLLGRMLVGQPEAVETLSLPPETQMLFCRLKEHHVDAELEKELVMAVYQTLSTQDLQELEKVREALETKIEETLKTSGPITLNGSGPRRVVLVGPTGGGKTTSLAKLAAEYALFRDKAVALITVDTYRIAAVDQLRTYSEIMGVPLEVAYTVEEFRAATAKHEDKDLILIDTAGRSPYHDDHLRELLDILSGVSLDEVHLVLPATLRFSDALETVDKFKIVPINRLLFTKLDETRSFGTLLSVVHQTQLSLSYVTNGQSVPEDIEEANPRKLAHLIMGASPEPAPIEAEQLQSENPSGVELRGGRESLLNALGGNGEGV